MTPLPPCYYCGATLQAGQVGMCSPCSATVSERANRPSSDASCSRCGWTLVTDWERIQHMVNDRHNYQATLQERRGPW